VERRKEMDMLTTTQVGNWNMSSQQSKQPASLNKLTNLENFIQIRNDDNNIRDDDHMKLRVLFVG
jgi:hypothetical protein